MSTDQPVPETFLGRERTWFGIKVGNYLLIILVIVFLLPFIRRGAQWAIQANNNNVADWLPANYAESAELTWFQRHFVGEQFALVSWEGCTLGDTQKLDLLAEKLAPQRTAAAENSTTRLFKKVITGPSVLEELTSSDKLEISYDEAIHRLEGALIGPLPPGVTDDAQRTTCLVVTLSAEGSKTNRMKREALDAIRRAAIECKIPMEGPGRIRFGGPPVDNVAIDIEGERTLIRLSVLAGAVGIILSYLCFRSFRLTAMIFAVGGLAAGISLAIVSYFGLLEQILLGLARPRYGTVDAILMSMPAVVYVLGLSGAIHMVNYYRDARREDGIIGAAEAAVRHAFAPCTLAALTTAVGLGSLFTSDILPIQKFGMFSAIGVIATLALLFSLLPACLHRYPPAEEAAKTDEKKGDGERHPLFSTVMHWFERIIIDHNGKVAFGMVLVMAGFGYGLSKIETRVQLLKLFDKDAVIIHDYAWLEEHLGNLVPMEVILAVDASHQRVTNEDAESDGRHYKLSMFERLQLVQRVQQTIDDLPETGRSLSAATFGPNLNVDASGVGGALVDPRSAIDIILRKNRHTLLAGDYLRDEIQRPFRPGEDRNEVGKTGRILLRISARLPALKDIDYGQFVHEIRAAVDPVLHVYRQRDDVLAALHKKGMKLRKSNVVIVFDSKQLAESRVKELELLESLLRDASARPRLYDLAQIPADADRQEVFGQINAALAKVECVVTAGDTGELDLKTLAADGPALVPLTKFVLDAEPDRTAVVGIRAAYTGVIPLVYKTQRELLISLQESMMWATVLIAVIMVVVFRSLPAGALSMLPNVFPIVLVFGAIGWLGIKVDIGIMMCASVALGVAVDDTVHFLTWFREGVREGLDNKAATRVAFERCAAAMFQTTLIAGVGLSVFAASTFTPTQQFGVLMLTLLLAALIGDLIFLPALLSGPLGRFFRSGMKPVSTDSNPTADADPPEETSPAGGPHISPQNKARRDLPHSSMRT